MKGTIVIDHVSYAYTPDQPVLRDIQLTLSCGTTAIIGQNGAGKTTLMKLLNGLLKPIEGQITIDDIHTADYETAQIAQWVGLVFQNPNDQIFKNRVVDEVMFGPLNIGMTESEARASALDALSEVGLSQMLDTNPYDLSYAERKRVCIASILAMRTDVVVFDEPTISQDYAGLQMIQRIIKSLRDTGKTVVAIVHDMNFVAENFERVVVMAEGKVISNGSPVDVFQRTDALSLANVDAPAVMKLSQRCGKAPAVTVDQFVANFRNYPS